MNVKRFTARSAREAMALVRQAFGDDAVVLSNKPCKEGVEVLAMAPEGMSQIEKVAATAPKVSAPSRVQARPKEAPLSERAARQAPVLFGDAGVNADVQALAMSTLSFQDYVRERMLKRRHAELNGGRTEPSMDMMPAEPELPPEGVASLVAARQQRAQAALQAMAPRQ
ncbi:flagellar biosynthesis protein FlhF, partial [Paucibacter sp. XJ19-41]|nr:flagellar biosynthesis protein FlhF [Paucibacter sp. XJ19-41]